MRAGYNFFANGRSPRQVRHRRRECPRITDEAALVKVFSWGILFGILIGVLLAWLASQLYHRFFSHRFGARRDREVHELRRKVAHLERVIEEKNRYIQEAVRAAVEDANPGRTVRKGV